MAKYNIVVVNPNGEVVGVEEYDSRLRPRSIVEAVARLSIRLGIPAPEIRGSGANSDALGNEWGKMSGEVSPGMIEIGFGSWGFPSQPARS